ncbi:GNAT family N-acetyltransferase [Mailhella sp.]|uniref:GNAT family N-acetyltransferase n=1 Tax=Mailhella sp. TaxID=1981029 RepID=UPI003AB6E495
MLEHIELSLEPVTENELPDFTRNAQEAFSVALRETFGHVDPIPSEDEVRTYFFSPGAASYHIMLSQRRIGGAMLLIDEKTQHNSLELFFITPEFHGHGVGVAAWKAIEKTYPDTAVWKTITPYFERRNIHFYVNKCKFHIVEFFHERHRDPNMPDLETQTDIPGTDAYFLFEKVMK